MTSISRDALRLASFDRLEGLEKQLCPKCKRRRMYFCYDCHQTLPGIFYPQVELPCKVDIIKHPKEKNSKSTAIHCKLSAPSYTQIYDTSNLPDYRKEFDGKRVVLVFPSPEAQSIEEFVAKEGPIDRLIFLDSTWFQVGTMQKLPQIDGLPCVHLKKYKTIFWRPQHNLDDHHLATIEAIYYSLLELRNVIKNAPYEGELDNLLYWFILMRGKFDAREEDYFKRIANGEPSRAKRLKTF